MLANVPGEQLSGFGCGLCSQCFDAIAQQRQWWRSSARGKRASAWLQPPANVVQRGLQPTTDAEARRLCRERASSPGTSGAGVLGAGVLGAGVLGAGMLEAGVLRVGVLGTRVCVWEAQARRDLSMCPKHRNGVRCVNGREQKVEELRMAP